MEEKQKDTKSIKEEECRKRKPEEEEYETEETRYKESIERDMYDQDAWHSLIGLAKKNKKNIEEEEELHVRRLMVFPTAANYWIEYVNFQLEHNKAPKKKIETIFQRCLPVLRDHRIWQLYLDYMEVEQHERYDILYDFYFTHMQYDMRAGAVWLAYIERMQQEDHKSQAIRDKYELALSSACYATQDLIHTYRAFEYAINETVATLRLKQEKEKHTLLMEEARKKKALYDAVRREEGWWCHAVPMGTNNAAQHQCWASWKKIIDNESENKLALSAKHHCAQMELVYQQALNELNQHLAPWFMYLMWHMTTITNDENDETDGIFEVTIEKKNPKTTLISTFTSASATAATVATDASATMTAEKKKKSEEEVRDKNIKNNISASRHSTYFALLSAHKHSQRLKKKLRHIFLLAWCRLSTYHVAFAVPAAPDTKKNNETLLTLCLLWADTEHIYGNVEYMMFIYAMLFFESSSNYCDRVLVLILVANALTKLELNGMSNAHLVTLLSKYWDTNIHKKLKPKSIQLLDIPAECVKMYNYMKQMYKLEPKTVKDDDTVKETPHKTMDEKESGEEEDEETRGGEEKENRDGGQEEKQKKKNQTKTKVKREKKEEEKKKEKKEAKKEEKKKKEKEEKKKEEKEEKKEKEKKEKLDGAGQVMEKKIPTTWRDKLLAIFNSHVSAKEQETNLTFYVSMANGVRDRDREEARTMYEHVVRNIERRVYMNDKYFVRSYLSFLESLHAVTEQKIFLHNVLENNGDAHAVRVFVLKKLERHEQRYGTPEVWMRCKMEHESIATVSQKQDALLLANAEPMTRELITITQKYKCHTLSSISIASKRLLLAASTPSSLPPRFFPHPSHAPMPSTHTFVQPRHFPHPPSSYAAPPHPQFFLSPRFSLPLAGVAPASTTAPTLSTFSHTPLSFPSCSPRPFSPFSPPLFHSSSHPPLPSAPPPPPLHDNSPLFTPTHFPTHIVSGSSSSSSFSSSTPSPYRPSLHFSTSTSTSSSPSFSRGTHPSSTPTPTTDSREQKTKKKNVHKREEAIGDEEKQKSGGTKFKKIKVFDL